jgi:hypothetical protein
MALKHYGLALIAELKRLYSPDVQDLRTWVPGSREFGILVQILAGSEGSHGEESFDITLCTPDWIMRQADKEGIISGHEFWRWYLVTAVPEAFAVAASK